MSHDALDLGVAALPYYDELIPLAHEAFGGVMDLLDIGARCIQDIEAAGTGILDDTRHDAVGTNDERALLDLGNARGSAHADAFEIVDDKRIVNEGAERIDGLAGLVSGLAYAGVASDLDVDVRHLKPPRVLSAQRIADRVHTSNGLVLNPLRALAALHALGSIFEKAGLPSSHPALLGAHDSFTSRCDIAKNANGHRGNGRLTHLRYKCEASVNLERLVIGANASTLRENQHVLAALQGMLGRAQGRQISTSSPRCKACWAARRAAISASPRSTGMPPARAKAQRTMAVLLNSDLKIGRTRRPAAHSLVTMGKTSAIEV